MAMHAPVRVPWISLSGRRVFSATMQAVEVIFPPDRLSLGFIRQGLHLIHSLAEAIVEQFHCLGV